MRSERSGRSGKPDCANFGKGADNGEAYEKAGTSLETVRKLIVDTLGDEAELVELSSSLSETKKLNEKGNRPMRLIMLLPPAVFG